MSQSSRVIKGYYLNSIYTAAIAAISTAIAQTMVQPRVCLWRDPPNNAIIGGNGRPSDGFAQLCHVLFVIFLALSKAVTRDLPMAGLFG
jgi:hypothetical protein